MTFATASGELITLFRKASQKFESRTLEAFKTGLISKHMTQVKTHQWSQDWAGSVKWLECRHSINNVWLAKRAKLNWSYLKQHPTTPTKSTQNHTPTCFTQSPCCHGQNWCWTPWSSRGGVVDKDAPLLKTWCYEDNGTTLKDNKDKVVAHLATSFPIPYKSQLKTGSIDTATFKCLEQMNSSDYMSVQVEALQAHDKAIQKLLLEKSDLKKVSSRSPKSGRI